MAEEGICVAIRARPMNGREKIQGQRSLWRCLPAHNSITLTNAEGNPLPDRNPGFTFFTYDKVFPENATTSEVYQAIGSPIVSSVLQGFNGTIFAYGQTSSGKTYTMVGDEASGEEGILHLAARDIFRLISETSDRDFLLRVSYVEIYNENIRDLLDPETPSLQIREDPRKGVYIEAAESIITDFDSILQALKTGSKHRRVEATAMNERSSRSHTIFRMVLESKERPKVAVLEGVGANVGEAAAAAVGAAAVASGAADVDGAVLVATLNLVDLAGSESVRHTGATGNRAKEGGKINQSLLTLSRVIHALGQEGNVHKGFRDSKLTRILQPSLSGNAKMAVVCCITSAEKYMEETRSTLQFASRAKMVRTCAVVNEVLDDQAQLKRLKKELQELKERQKQLEGLGGTGGGGGLSLEDVNRLEAEKELMTGKVEELEAVREDQANKINRLKDLILQGGGMMMGQGGLNESALMPLGGGASSRGMGMGGGIGGRRPKRLRETWCPGESGVPLPPGAAVRALQEVAHDDEADDQLISKLNFGGIVKVTKRRAGSSSSAGATGGGGSSLGDGRSSLFMLNEELNESANNSYLSESRSSMAQEGVGDGGNADCAAASLQEMARIREILAECQAVGMEEGGDEGADLASLIKTLVAKVQRTGTSTSDDNDTMQMVTDSLAPEKEVNQLPSQTDEKDGEIASLRQALEEAQQTKTESVRERGTGSLHTEEVQNLTDALAEREGTISELRQSLLQAEESVGAANTRIQELDQELVDLNQQLANKAEAEENVATLKEALAQSQAKAVAAESQIESLNANILQLTAEVQGKASKDGSERQSEMERRERAEAAMEDMMAQCTRARFQLEVLQQQLEFARDEREVMVEEAAHQEKEAELIKARTQYLEGEHQSTLTTLQQVIPMLHIPTPAADDGNSNTSSIADLASLVFHLQEQLDARIKSAESELRGHEEENAGLKEKLAKAMARRSSAINWSETGLSTSDAHEQVMKELRRKIPGGQEADAAVEGAEEMVTEEVAEDVEEQEPSSSCPDKRKSCDGVMEAGDECETATKRLKENHYVEQEEELAESAMSAAAAATTIPEGQGVMQQEGEEEETPETMPVSSVEATQENVAEEEDEALCPEDMAEEITRLGIMTEALEDQLRSLKEILNGRQAQLNAAQESLSTKEAECTRLGDELLVSREKQVESEVKAEEAMAGLATKEEEMTTLNNRLVELEQAMAQAPDEAEVVKLRSKTESLTAELEHIRSEVESLKGKLAEAAGNDDRLQSLQEEVAEKAAELETLRIAFADATAASEGSEEVKKQLIERQQQLKVALERIEELSTKFNELTETVVQRDAAMEKEKRCVEEATNKVTTLEIKLKALQEEKTAVPSMDIEETAEGSAAAASSSPSEAPADSSKAHAKLLNEQNARSDLENSLQETSQQLQQAREELRHSENRVDEALKALEEAKVEARKDQERLDLEVSKRDADVTALQEQLQTMSHSLKQTQEALNMSESSAQGTERDDVSLRKRLSQVQTQLDLAQSLVSKHEARIKEVETENKRVMREAEDDVTKLRRELDMSSKGMAQMSVRDTEVMGLKDAHQALTKKLATLKEEKEDAEQRANRTADALEALEMEVAELRNKTFSFDAPSTSSSAAAVAEVDQVRHDLEQAQASEANIRSEANQLQNRQKRLQKEVEALRQECSKARDKYESMKEEKERLQGELDAAQAAPAPVVDEERSLLVIELRATLCTKEQGLASLGEEMTRAKAELEAASKLKQGLEQQVEALKEKVKEDAQQVEALKETVKADGGKVEGLEQRLTTVQSELEAAQTSAAKAETSRADLLKELNTLFEAKFEAESRASLKEQEVEQLCKTLQEAQESAVQSAEVEDLRAQLAVKEQEYSTMHGESYRMKRELSELKEAADAAEEAMGSQVNELQQLKDTASQLQATITQLKADMKAKDERIRKLDAVKLTTDQVEKLRKIKEEHARFSADNKQLREELAYLKQQHAVSKAAALAESGANEALDAQAKTIAELMTARDTLQEKLRTSAASCRKLELERMSALETLQEIPVEGMHFEQVPDNLGVAVGILVERLTNHLAEGRTVTEKNQNDRSLLVKELRTLTEEKESLKEKIAELQAGADGAEEMEDALKQKMAGVTMRLRQMEDEVAKTESRVQEMEMDHKAVTQETARQIRFLEKENLELMMEIKKLKDHIIKIQAEVDVFRGQHQHQHQQAPPSYHHHQQHHPQQQQQEMMLPPPCSSSSSISNTALRPIGGSHLSSSSNIMSTSNSSSNINSQIDYGYPPSKPSSVTKPSASSGYRSQVPVMDKENILVGENLMQLEDHDETAPPFRSLVDDETGAANQCKQS